MKRIILILLIFGVLLSAKIELIHSHMGVLSHGISVSYLDDNGKLKTKVWNEECRRIADMGGTGIRILPFWYTKIQDGIYLPFKIDRGKYSLLHYNKLYFDNLRKLVEIANKYNLRIWMSLYDRCNAAMFYEIHPWIRNINKVKWWYYTKADYYRKKWENKVFETLKGLNVGWELENEPFNPNFLNSGVKTIKNILAHGYKQRDIMVGIDRLHDEAYQDKFNMAMYQAGVYDKYNQYSVIHQIDLDKIKILIKSHAHKIPNRRFWISDDGIHPKYNSRWWKKHIKILVDGVGYNVLDKCNWAIEHLCRSKQDDYNSIKAIYETLAKYGYKNSNYGNYKYVISDPEPTPKPTPIPIPPIKPDTPECKFYNSNHRFTASQWFNENNFRRWLKATFFGGIKKCRCGKWGR